MPSLKIDTKQCRCTIGNSVFEVTGHHENLAHRNATTGSLRR
jgi:hypothetical protein